MSLEVSEESKAKPLNSIPRPSLGWALLQLCGTVVAVAASSTKKRRNTTAVGLEGTMTHSLSVDQTS
eukprot:scaffold48_cov161-Amphora_coffeaeformis.AAC.30